MPDDRPGEVPGDRPGKAPGETPGKAPGETPGEAPGEGPDDPPGEAPDEGPGEAPDYPRRDRPGGVTGADGPAPAPRKRAERRVQRPRDPQARRDALAAATIEVIAEVGIGRATHRAVAARAGLPLGATTYYFPDLDALIAAGLGRAAEALQADICSWAGELRESADLASTLVTLAEEYLADRRRAQIEYELYVAAARDATLRPLAEAWLRGMHEGLVPHVGAAAAGMVSALLDGAMLQSLVSGKPLDAPALTDAIRRLTSS